MGEGRTPERKDPNVSSGALVYLGMTSVASPVLTHGAPHGRSAAAVRRAVAKGPLSRGMIASARRENAAVKQSANVGIVATRWNARQSTRRPQVAARCFFEEQELPLVGNKAPDFTAQGVYDQEFTTVSLEQYRGRYLILFFYPLDFTFVCPTEITAFSDRHAEFAALNCDVLGVSVDSQFSHLAWTQMSRQEGGLGDLKYTLVSDLKKEISDSYGVLTEGGMALRGLFIIDKEGVIQHSTINNLAFGRSVDETLRTLQALQYVQENEDEVCPANWKPGDKTMNPTPEGSKEFFAAIE